MIRRFPYDLDRLLLNPVSVELLGGGNYTEVLSRILLEFQSDLTRSNATLQQILAVKHAGLRGIPAGVLSVLVVTTLLSVGWTACVTYILVEFALMARHRRASRISRNSSSVSRTSHRQSMRRTASDDR